MSNSPRVARPPRMRRLLTRVTATIAAAAVIAAGAAAPAQAAIDPAGLTLEQLRKPLPAADLLDVDFAGGTAVDHSPKARPLTPGAAASVVDDADLGIPVAVGAEGTATAFKTPAFDAGDYAALADGFTVETVVRVDAIAGSYVDLVSGQESGGIGLEANRINGDASRFRLDVWTTSSGTRPAVTLEYGKWYHVAATWDGTKAQLFVDGGVVSTTTAGFDVDPANTAARYLAIGGDANPAGALDNKTFSGRLALARLYSAPVTELDAYRLSRLALPRLDTVAPIIEPSGTVPTDGSIGDTITFPGAEAIDDTGVVAEVVVTVTGPDGVVAAITPNSDGTYSFVPAVAGDYTVSFAATDAAGHTGDETATIAVSGDGTEPTDPEGPVDPEQPTAPGEPDIRFAAIGDIHDNWSELAEAYDFWNEQGTDAALFVGDLTNSATASEYQGLKDTIDSKAGYGIDLVAALGNHDVNAISSYDLFTQSTGGQKPNADYVINGYHFITVAPGAGTLDETTGKPSVANSGSYAYASSWLQQRLAADTAEDPTKPVFVLVHHPQRCTHYVSNEWYGTGLTTGCGNDFQSVFDAYPQAVVWAGHIHTPQNISSSIWQGQENRAGALADKGFTTVNAPPLAYYEFERGVINTNPTSRTSDSTPDDAGDNRQTTIVEVYGSQVTIKNYDLLSDRWIDQTWTWDVADSVDTGKSYDERFPLNSTFRASQTSAPVWPAGSAVTVSGVSGDKAMVAFPQAVPAANPVQDIVHKYRYTTVDVQTGQTVNTFLQWSGFYNLPMPASRNHEVWNLTAGREYEVRITPINTWGKEGAALSARFVAGGSTDPGDPPFDPATLTFDDLAAAIPTPDLLDVGFEGGTAVDLSPRQRTMTAGADASVVADPDAGGPVAVGRQGAASAYRTGLWSDADYALLQDGFTVDATFKIDSIDKGVGGYVDVFGGMQSGGIGLEAVRTASTTSYELEFWYADPRPVVTLEYGRWYHVTGWYDGTDARLYVDGLKSVSTSGVSFPVKPSTAAARYMAIGGDANGSGSLDDATFNGRIAGAGLYSTPLADKDVYRSAMHDLTKLDAVPPQVRVVPAPPAQATAGKVYTAPPAQAVDNSGRVTAKLEVTDPKGAPIAAQPVEGGGFAFTPAAAGTYTLNYTATDAAARQANVSFEVVASPPADTTAPIVTVKTDATTIPGGAQGAYEQVSFKLSDAGKIDRVVLNGVVKDLVDDVWSDLNKVRPGVFGAVLGANTLQVYDVAGNVTTVTFTLVKRHPVTVVAGEHGTASAEPGRAQPGTTVTLAADPDDGYHLGGWRLTPTDVVVAADGTFVQPDAPVTATAGFEANRYTISFDANGGEGAQSALEAVYDRDAPLPVVTLSREGHAFAGWARGASGEVEFDDRQTVRNLTAEQGGTVTLYAVWKATAPEAVVAPSITGTARVGGILFATPGEWDGAGLTFAYQWRADGVAIDGQTGATLRVGSSLNGATISVRVTATHPERPDGRATSAGTRVAALPAWQTARVYVEGDTVLSGGKVYRALWWTKGDLPGASAKGAWAELGAEVSTPQGVIPAWTASWVYLGGEKVAFGGHLYQASWWTRGQQPGGGKHSAWKDLGAY